VVAVVNALCLAGALGGARALMQQLGLSRCRGLVFWGIALWPGHVLCAGLPEKELVITALLPWILAWALRSRVTGWPAAALAGALLGLAVLVQPSLQFLPLGVLAGVLLWSPARKQDLVSALVALLAMVAVVAPWSWRNHNVLGEVVAVSTNGGDVLYRANNELATGVYTARAAVVLDALSELDRDRESKRLAWRWILGHPVSFAQLAASKLLHFMGDDSYGAYAVFSRGQVPLGRPAYLLVRQASALPWLLAWLLMLGWVGPPRAAQAGAWLLVAWPLLYLAAIHAVFESGPKYHLPLLVPFLVLLAQAGSRRLAVRP